MTLILQNYSLLCHNYEHYQHQTALKCAALTVYIMHISYGLKRQVRSQFLSIKNIIK